MEQKKDKVKQAAFWQEGENDYGKTYAHIVEMENGDKGVYNSKSKEQDKFVEGQEVEYQWRPPKEGKKLGIIKPVKTQYGGKSHGSQKVSTVTKESSLLYSKQEFLKQKMNVASFAASYAKDILTARGDTNKDDFKKYFDEIVSKMNETLDNINIENYFT